MDDNECAVKTLALLMIFCLTLVICGVFLQGCEYDSSYGDVIVSNDLFSYSVKSFDPFRDDDSQYTVDKNTNVVYIRTYSDGIRGITVAYNKDGTVMKLEDLTKLLEDK